MQRASEAWRGEGRAAYPSGDLVVAVSGCPQLFASRLSRPFRLGERRRGLGIRGELLEAEEEASMTRNNR